jgi:hypothetical protein
MKVLGRTPNGGAIVELSLQENEAIGQFGYGLPTQDRRDVDLATLLYLLGQAGRLPEYLRELADELEKKTQPEREN